jgi:hypothetical protein
LFSETFKRGAAADAAEHARRAAVNVQAVVCMVGVLLRGSIVAVAVQLREPLGEALSCVTRDTHLDSDIVARVLLAI